MDTNVPVLAQTGQNENGTNLAISWDNLGRTEREIIMAVVFAGSPEEARKRLSMSHSTFYRKWGNIKGYYNDLLKEFPKKAGEVLISQSIKAAQELGNELNSDNEKIRHQAATQVLDRTLSKEPLGLKRKITLEEFDTKIFNKSYNPHS